MPGMSSTFTGALSSGPAPYTMFDAYHIHIIVNENGNIQAGWR